jgi:gliding motility-associated-like protein
VVIPVADTSLSITTIPVPILDDNIIEGNELIEISISNITTAPGITIDYYSNDRAYVGIIDDDAANITIAGAVNGKEGGTPGSITLSYSDDLVAAEDVLVSYHIDSAGTTATPGADFTMPAAIIPAGQHSATIPITIINDNEVEDTEYIHIVVTDSARGNNLSYPVGPVTDVVVSIEDNDRTYTHCPPNKLMIPNVITPNGDGKDDKFVIRGLENYPGSKLYIYNLLRGGILVYQSKDYANNWDGQGCYQGLYSYLLEVKEGGRMKIYRGPLVIIR